MLTEVLLEVTDSEVHGIAREVYNKSRATASKGIAYNITWYLRWVKFNWFSLKLIILLYKHLYPFLCDFVAFLSLHKVVSQSQNTFFRYNSKPNQIYFLSPCNFVTPISTFLLNLVNNCLFCIIHVYISNKIISKWMFSCLSGYIINMIFLLKRSHNSNFVQMSILTLTSYS